MSDLAVTGWPALAPVGTMPSYPGMPEKGTPLWWVARLDRKLQDRNKRLDVYDDYYEGRHPLAFASEKFRKAFGGLFEEFSDNWCGLVVDAVEERLNPTGFRYGDDPSADQDAWLIWQANGMDAQGQMGITEALVREESSAIVWFDVDDELDGVGVKITIEDPSQVIVETIPGTRRRSAALKVWTDDDNRRMATLYLPDAIWKFQARHSGGTGLYIVGNPGPEWEPRQAPGDDTWPITNTLGVVPVVPLVNRPRLLKPGSSEIRHVMPVQNGINKLLADMLVASEFGAFRQRWVTGMDIPTDPETDQPIEAFKSATDRMFHAESKETTFGEFNATDLTNFKIGIEMLVQHVASQTRTPPHYFYLGGGQPPSGESIKSAETGLVAKTRRKMRFLGEGLEEIMRLCFLVLGDRRGKITHAETIWADPESRTEAEHIDATVKKLAIGVPLQQLWEDAGYSPPQIARFKTMRVEEATWVTPASVPAAITPALPAGDGTGDDGTGDAPPPDPTQQPK